MARLTALRRENLQWIADNEPVGWLSPLGPSIRQVNNFAKDGLVERVPDNRPIHLIKWRLTEAGRRALQAEGGE